MRKIHALILTAFAGLLLFGAHAFASPPSGGYTRHDGAHYYSGSVTFDGAVAFDGAVISSQQAQVRQVRGVVTGNVSDLTSFTVASNDGLTYAAGQRVLLVGQSTKSQNGIYVVGTVATGTAPLTRPTDFATGTVLPGGVVFEVNAGTLFANTEWKITTAGSITIGTTNFDAYPKSVTQSVTLVAGVKAVTNVPILSATKSQFTASLNTQGGTSTTTVGFGPIAAATPGVVGTATVTFNAIAAGLTANTSDTSIINVTISNW